MCALAEHEPKPTPAHSEWGDWLTKHQCPWQIERLYHFYARNVQMDAISLGFIVAVFVGALHIPPSCCSPLYFAPKLLVRCTPVCKLCSIHKGTLPKMRAQFTFTSTSNENPAGRISSRCCSNSLSVGLACTTPTALHPHLCRKFTVKTPQCNCA